MTDKREFLCVYDYGQGGIWFTFYARTKKEIEEKYPSFTAFEDKPKWMNEAEKATYMTENKDKDMWWDIDDEPTGWLAESIYITQRESEGKWPFLFRSISSGVTEYRTIWAREESEITSQYSGLENMVGVGIPVEDLAGIGISDIDVSDEFLKKHRNDA